MSSVSATVAPLAPRFNWNRYQIRAPEGVLLSLVRRQRARGPAQAGFESVDALQQLERQRDAGQIDAEVALQAARLLHAHNAGGGKAPLWAARTHGLENTLLDELHDPFGLDAAGARQLIERDLVRL